MSARPRPVCRQFGMYDLVVLASSAEMRIFDALFEFPSVASRRAFVMSSEFKIKPLSTLKHYPAVTADRMMNSRLHCRIQERSRGKSLTGEGVPGQRTMNEQVRGVKNRVNIEPGGFKRRPWRPVRSNSQSQSALKRVQLNLRLLWPCSSATVDHLCC